VHSLLLASASAWQGEPAVAANLAIVAAQSGFETVLIDADLHQPGLHKRFTLANRSGLSDLLESGDLTPEIIAENLQTTFVAGLRFLSAGSALTQGSALLLSPRLVEVAKCIHDLLAVHAQKPGVIVYHSPSVLSSPDASLLSAHVEQTVLAVIIGKTTRQQAKQAQEQLRLAQAQLAGVILLKS
jgi:Mrp family chromosome partitioning ATPase